MHIYDDTPQLEISCGSMKDVVLCGSMKKQTGL